MAYAATHTTQIVGQGPRRFAVVTVIETGITASANEYAITGIPAVGRVTEVEANLTPGSGSATVIDTRIGERTGRADVFDNGTPAADIHDVSGGKRYTAPDGKLFVSSRADGTTAGATGKVITRITIALDHDL